MVQVIKAVFEDGVFKPDEQPLLAPHSRVRLLVETTDGGDDHLRQKGAWDTIEELWRQSSFNSQGDRLSRDQLHERG